MIYINNIQLLIILLSKSTWLVIEGDLHYSWDPLFLIFPEVKEGRGDFPALTESALQTLPNQKGLSEKLLKRKILWSLQCPRDLIQALCGQRELLSLLQRVKIQCH